MARSSKKRRQLRYVPNAVIGVFLVLAIGTVSLAYVNAGSMRPITDAVLAKEDTNFHVETMTRQFFEDNDAAEMIPIIRCESNFRQFERDGTPLKNREGSSATGVAQILASKHPDPKIVARYNRLYDMDLDAANFDIKTLEGNLGYALVLYKVRGTRDWECAKKFRW